MLFYTSSGKFLYRIFCVSVFAFFDIAIVPLVTYSYIVREIYEC